MVMEFVKLGPSYSEMQSSVLFCVHCSVQVAEHFLKILGFSL